MHPIAMETWMTTRWPNQVFCFLLAVTVVNVQNAGVYFCGFPKVDAPTARKLIAQQLLENKYNQLLRSHHQRGHDMAQQNIVLFHSPQEENSTRATSNLQEQIPNLEMLLQACPCEDILPVHSRSASLLRMLC